MLGWTENKVELPISLVKKTLTYAHGYTFFVLPALSSPNLPTQGEKTNE